MGADGVPDFLAVAAEWWAAADALRAAGVPAHDPALRVWREAAWCHVLLARGRHDALTVRLRAAVAAVTGMPPTPAASPTTAAEGVAAAAVLFGRLRAAVSARHPRAFPRPAAA